MAKFRVILDPTRNGSIRVRHQMPDGKRYPDYCVGKNESAIIDGKSYVGRSLAKMYGKKVEQRYHANELGGVDPEADLAGLIEKHLDDDLVKGNLPLSRKNKSFSLYKFLNDNNLTRLGQLTTEVIESWKIAMVKAGRVNVTVRGHLSNVRTWVHWLKKKGHVKVDLFGEGMMPTRLEREPHYYVMEEFQALDRVMAAISSEGRKAIYLAHDAGLRKIEITGHPLGGRRGVRYEDIERSPNGVWILHLRKEVVKGCKHARSIPLTDRLIELLGTKRTGPLVDLKYQQLTNKFVRARRLAKLTKEFGFGKLTVHGLRHTFAKNSLQWGDAPTSAVGDMLGHQDPVSTRVYAQFEKNFFGQIIHKSQERRLQEEARVDREAI